MTSKVSPHYLSALNDRTPGMEERKTDLDRRVRAALIDRKLEDIPVKPPVFDPPKSTPLHWISTVIRVVSFGLIGSNSEVIVQTAKITRAVSTAITGEKPLIVHEGISSLDLKKLNHDAQRQWRNEQAAVISTKNNVYEGELKYTLQGATSDEEKQAIVLAATRELDYQKSPPSEYIPYVPPAPKPIQESPCPVELNLLPTEDPDFSPKAIFAIGLAAISFSNAYLRPMIADCYKERARKNDANVLQKLRAGDCGKPGELKSFKRSVDSTYMKTDSSVINELEENYMKCFKQPAGV